MTARALAAQAQVRQEQSGYSNLVWDAAVKSCQPPLTPRRLVIDWEKSCATMSTARMTSA